MMVMMMVVVMMMPAQASTQQEAQRRVQLRHSQARVRVAAVLVVVDRDSAPAARRR